MTVADKQSAVEQADDPESTSRRRALKLGLTGAGLAAGGAALSGLLGGTPAGASGTCEVKVLQLTYAGTTVTTTAVLPPGYDPTVGGIVSGVMILGSDTVTCPLIEIDGTATVVRAIIFIDFRNAIWVLCSDGQRNKVPWGFIGLTQEVSTGRPGNINPDDVRANIGMITPDLDGSLWVCTTNFAPTADWHHHLVPYGDTGGGAPATTGSYVGQLATDGAAGVLYMWNGSSWLSTTLT
jgi:hypothetical protein